MRLRDAFVGFVALLLVPFAASAQSTKVIDPTTGVAVFSATNPAPINEAQVAGATLSTGNGVVGTGVQRVAIASDNTAFSVNTAQATAANLNAQVVGNVAAAATDSGNPVKAGGVYTAAAPTLTDGQRGNLRLDPAAFLYSIVAGPGTYHQDAIPDGDISALRANGFFFPVQTAGLVFNGATWDRAPGSTAGSYTVPKPVTSGGLTPLRLVGATNGVIKASAGQLYTGTLTNANAAIRYLQIYNKATAGTLSTDTPLMTVPLPPNATVMIDFSGIGGAFATGISWQLTTDDIAIPTTAGSTTDIHGYVTFK
jgi:hypothetical protein